MQQKNNVLHPLLSYQHLLSPRHRYGYDTSKKGPSSLILYRSAGIYLIHDTDHITDTVNLAEAHPSKTRQVSSLVTPEKQTKKEEALHKTALIIGHWTRFYPPTQFVEIDRRRILSRLIVTHISLGHTPRACGRTDGWMAG